jgi:TIR domain
MSSNNVNFHKLILQYKESFLRVYMTARTVKKPRIRRTSRDIFLDKLKSLTTVDVPLITNQSLREALSWEEFKYDQIKRQLSTEGVIVNGRGYGGKVGLSYGKDVSPISVFISYSHEDEKLKEQLLKHLSPLKRLGLISEWNDRKLVAGDNWAQEISTKLTASRIILMLISIDFINSKYCYDIELEKALELHESGKAVVIPIILRNCMWQHTPFAKYQALPKDGKAVKTWQDIDEAFANIAEGIKTKAEEFLEDV